MPDLTDTELLDGLERVLRERDEIHEFWLDKDAEILWAGDGGGSTLREALKNLLTVPTEEDLQKVFDEAVAEGRQYVKEQLLPEVLLGLEEDTDG